MSLPIIWVSDNLSDLNRTSANQIDVQTVAWLEQYLSVNNLPDITCLIVSHDSGFLDNVCTDIVCCHLPRQDLH
jgi:ATPase subunit of ABC transporter with duplicated ATPase domains